MTNLDLARRMISETCPQRERAIADLTHELARKRCDAHSTYKASMPPKINCPGCWVVWRARGNPPPP